MASDISHRADLLVLHTLRCMGFSTVRRLGADRVPARPPDTGAIADELDSTGARAAMREAYERFDLLNPHLLDACTRWQTRRPGSATIVTTIPTASMTQRFSIDSRACTDPSRRSATT